MNVFFNKFLSLHNTDGGQDTSDATAIDWDIMKGKSAYVNGKKIEGRIPDNRTRTSNGNVPGINTVYKEVPVRPEDQGLQYSVGTDNVARICMCPPQGYYQGSGASYIGKPATDFGNATRNDVVSGKTFTSKDGLKISGSMPYYANQYNIKNIWWNNDVFVTDIERGYYHGKDFGPNVIMPINTARQKLGINSNKIMNDTTIMGVRGNIPSMGIVVDSLDRCEMDHNAMYVTIPNGAYMNNSWTGHPEIKISTDKVRHALRLDVGREVFNGATFDNFVFSGVARNNLSFYPYENINKLVDITDYYTMQINNSNEQFLNGAKLMGTLGYGIDQSNFNNFYINGHNIMFLITLQPIDLMFFRRIVFSIKVLNNGKTIYTGNKHIYHRLLLAGNQKRDQGSGYHRVVNWRSDIRDIDVGLNQRDINQMKYNLEYDVSGLNGVNYLILQLGCDGYGFSMSYRLPLLIGISSIKIY